MKRKLLSLAIVTVLVLTGCAPAARAPTATPQPTLPSSGEAARPAAYPGADWAWADSPESLGWSTDKLAAAQAYAKRIGSAAVMIVDDGVVVAGWGDLERKYLCHSMRKSLISALYGIYVAEGKIDLTATLKDLGIDDLTPLTDVEKTATVKDLLSARSGVYIEAAGEAASMKAMRPQRGSHAPGTFWYYNNWDFNALGTIFDQLSGEKNIYTAFDQRIAQPIGMQDYDPSELRYGYESFSKHPYYGFRMSTRDLARFGLLFLRQGRWGETQVVTADWVRESTTAHSDIGPQSGYGYMWWTGEGVGAFPNVDEGPGSYYASGYGGHEVIVMPARNLVVVHRADTDAAKMVDEPSIGTLLWLILDAAGETDIGPAPLLERAEGTRLTAETLPQTLRGCTLHGSVSGMELLAIYGPDDSLALTLNGAPLTAGRWWIEGDDYCHDLGPDYGGPHCGTIVVNGNELSWFDADGYVSLRFEYAQPLGATAPAPTATPQPLAQKLATFEAVWNTVDQTYFDPHFGGVDWRAVHDEYEPLIRAAQDDEAFYELLNQMLWKLNVSHLGVGPADKWLSVEPVVWEAGEIGIDVRLLDDQAVITRVEAGSPAERAALRPGFVIHSIEGSSVEQIIAEAQEHLAPPYNDQSRLDLLTRRLLGLIYGDPGTCVTLAYLDESDELHQTCVERVQRPRSAAMVVALPPSRLEFESRRLESGIGYIRFNTFHGDLLPDLVEAVAALQDAPGIIIDVRGNPGGDASVAEQMAAQFLHGQGLFGKFRTRAGNMARVVTGKNAYAGPLVILIDALSYSASEWFASGMQALGRAVVVGQRSPGGATGANVAILPNGAILLHPVIVLLAPDGTVLEGRGVIPDISVTLQRSELLQGTDAQLQAAIDHILQAVDNWG